MKKYYYINGFPVKQGEWKTAFVKLVSPLMIHFELRKSMMDSFLRYFNNTDVEPAILILAIPISMESLYIKCWGEQRYIIHLARIIYLDFDIVALMRIIKNK